MDAALLWASQGEEGVREVDIDQHPQKCVCEEAYDSQNEMVVEVEAGDQILS